MSRNRYLVSYDISDQKRLHHIFKIMNDYGDHIQLSVFLCELNPRERIKMETELREIIKFTEDQILIINLGSVEKNIKSFVYSIGREYVAPTRIIVV